MILLAEAFAPKVLAHEGHIPGFRWYAMYVTKEKFLQGYLFCFAVIWILYSLMIWVRPDILAQISSIGIQHWSAVVEVRSMYGGLECGLGLFALAGVLNPSRYLRSNVLMWMLVNGFLVVGRVSGIIIDGGTFAVPMGVLPDAYNSGALWLLEGPSFIVFAWYWFTVYYGKEQ